MTGTSDDGFPGQKSPSDTSSDFNVTTFLVRQMLGRVRTVQLATVKAVTNHSEVEGVGFVDVQLMVNMLDGKNQSSQHTTMYGLPYFRTQGGANAIIMDPKVGDIGIVAVCDRDISAVKKAKKVSNPGSLRRFNLADGIYLGGVLNGVPTQYVRFVTDAQGVPTGMEIKDISGNEIQMTQTGMVMVDKYGHVINMYSGGVDITGDVSITGKITSTKDASFAGGAQAVKLADGTNATKVKAT